MSVLRKLTVVMVVAVLSLTACGGSGGSQEVKITLNEFGIQSSVTEFKVGVPYHFVVTNEGQLQHEIMLMAPLTVEQMTMDMEKIDSMTLAHVEEEDLQPGATAEFDYTFTEPAPAGTLEFSCHLPSHYEAGMKLPITVQ